MPLVAKGQLLFGVSKVSVKRIYMLIKFGTCCKHGWVVQKLVKANTELKADEIINFS